MDSAGDTASLSWKFVGIFIAIFYTLKFGTNKIAILVLGIQMTNTSLALQDSIDESDDDDVSDADEEDVDLASENATAVTRFLIKTFPKQLSTLKNEKTELEERIQVEKLFRFVQ